MAKGTKAKKAIAFAFRLISALLFLTYGILCIRFIFGDEYHGDGFDPVSFCVDFLTSISFISLAAVLIFEKYQIIFKIASYLIAGSHIYYACNSLVLLLVLTHRFDIIAKSMILSLFFNLLNSAAFFIFSAVYGKSKINPLYRFLPASIMLTCFVLDLLGINVRHAGQDIILTLSILFCSAYPLFESKEEYCYI